MIVWVFTVMNQMNQINKRKYRATGGNRALLNDYHRKSDSLAQWKINFLPDTATQIYGFDYLGSGNHGIYTGSEYYPYLSGNYDLRYKSVESGKSDKVVVDFGSYPEKDSVIFKDKYGVTLKLSKGNILNFTGVNQADTNYIYAYRGDEKIGKLSVNTYKQKTYNVVLVSVNGAKLPKIGKLEDYLNKVYKQSVVNFEISTDELILNDLTSFSHGGSGVLTVYNDDQKKVLQAYDSQMQDGVYYLFFVDNVTDKKDGNGTLVSGYMPRGYNCGFIYDGGSEHTVAHELGHGIAGLEHVFENSKTSGKTKNLMDYSSGEELWHFQWDAIQDPSRVWMKWNKYETEGELIQNLAIDKYFNVKNEGWENCAFLSPNGAAIIIPDVTHVLFNEDGAVLNFIINGIKYFGVFIKETQTFYGYVSESNKDLINNQILTIETNGDLNKIRYTNIKFAQLGDTVVCIYKQPYNDTYLDCINLAKWPNAQVHKDYLGVANSKYVPNQAVIIHLRGNGCVELDDNLISGYGTDIFVNLVNKIDSLKRAELIEFCNYFSETTRKKKFAFYNEKLKDELQTGVFTQATIRYFIENKIYNRTIFDKHFLFKFDTRDFDLVFSDIDLWEGINRETYNKNSKSYHYNKGGNYSYSLDDLKKRQVYKNTQTALFTAIANFEKEGNAQPISMKDGCNEYVAKYKTNSAFVAWADFMSQSYDDLTKAYLAYSLSAMELQFLGNTVNTSKSVFSLSQNGLAIARQNALLYSSSDAKILCDLLSKFYSKSVTNGSKVLNAVSKTVKAIAEKSPASAKKFAEGASQKLAATFIDFLIAEVAHKINDSTYECSFDHYLEKYIYNGNYIDLLIVMTQCGISNMYGNYEDITVGWKFAVKLGLDCFSVGQKWFSDFNIAFVDKQPDPSLLEESFYTCVLNVLLGVTGSQLHIKNEFLNYFKGIGVNVTQDQLRDWFDRSIKREKIENKYKDNTVNNN